VLTWNIWFDDLAADCRLKALFQELLSVAPDVVCLQEVKPGAAEAIRACTAVCAVYDVSPFDVGLYGNLTLIRKDMSATFVETAFPSDMGRTLLLGECHARCEGMLIANVHLESLAAEHIRREQLKVTADALAGHEHVLICGDFNFDATRTFGDWARETPERTPLTIENRVLVDVLPDFADSWPVVRDDEGFTFDGEFNPQCIQNPHERMRYDRVLAKTGKSTLRPIAASLLGTSEINSWGLMPSDHFGLQVDLVVGA
jgi:endonuclease/exonuclease/phosphatase family metal-dependent hydrolase